MPVEDGLSQDGGEGMDISPLYGRSSRSVYGRRARTLGLWLLYRGSP